ncbi:basic amino acid ABC transporter substrate-binding protein [Aneurinibacillus terranovensis]|uniref:basic amino acid ABC transporter substrate-binding protein n=1 Tax=Aneurinibacillus terranovensis TaxID=278991 RepID=UPI00042921E6|nr:basic amino acid ABC transporter substrate-binding protein [Aneurinibacillus terranovensis]
MKKISLFLLIAILLLTIAGCGGAKNTAGSAGDASSSKADTLVVGTDASFPPFESLSPTGDPVGFDMDLIKAIAASQHIHVELKNTGWDGMMSGLKDGSVQIGIAGITVTNDRKKSFDFTSPYFTAKQVILVKENGPAASVKKVTDLKGKLIGVQSGTTGASLVEDTFGKGYAGLKAYEEIAGAIDDLQNGRIQAVIADNAVIKKFVNQLNLKQVKIVEDPSVKPETYGIAVKKGNTELLNKLNKGLTAVKQNGKYDAIFNQYMGK